MHESGRRPPARVVDAGVVAAVAAVGLAGLYVPVLLADADPARTAGAALPLVVAQAAVLWWRRDRPLVVLAVVLAALLAAQVVGDENAASLFGPHVAAYSVGAYAPRRQALLGLAGMGVAALLDVAIAAWGIGAGAFGPVALTPLSLLVLGAWGAGRYVAVRRAYVQALIAYGHQLEKDRDERARAAVRNERRRIARDLHDQVAHHLGVVSLQTAAARRWVERDPDRTASALSAAEQAARSALETMPAILHALRSDDGPATLSPQPTLDDVPDLVSSVTGDEVTAELRVVGDHRALPPAVEVTAYRVVQEALTNVVNHAGPAHAVVELRFAGDRLEVEVADDGRGPAAGSSNGSRLGLIGMRERVELLSGALEVGPRSGGGFVVHATLPVAGGGR